MAMSAISAAMLQQRAEMAKNDSYVFISRQVITPPVDDTKQALDEALERANPVYAAKIAYDCKATAFFVDASIVLDGPPSFVGVRLRDLDGDRIQCIVQDASKEGFEIKFSTVPDRRQRMIF